MTKNTVLISLLGVLVLGGVFVLAQKTDTPDKVSVVAPGTAATTTSPTPTSVSQVHAYGKVTLRVGETVIFKDMLLRVRKVVDDSRCAEGVQCIWAGTVKAEITLVSGMGTSTQTVELGKTLTTEAESITFVSVTPYPKQGGSITQSDHVLTFDITKRTQAAASGTTCYVGGCSGEVCSDTEGVASNCVYQPQFACYKNAKCERQPSGECGWTDNSTLRTCIATQSKM